MKGRGKGEHGRRNEMEEGVHTYKRRAAAERGKVTGESRRWKVKGER